MRRRGAFAVAAIAAPAVAVLLALPPWMVIDADDPGGRHAALGHHPRWQPPTPDAAERVLASRAAPPRAGVQPSLRIGVNRVRLAGEIITVAAAALCALGALRWHRRKSVWVAEEQGRAGHGREQQGQ